jgi:hypothetical protein
VLKRGKKVKSKLFFAELLAKYKRGVHQKQRSQLGDNTRSQRSPSPER